MGDGEAARAADGTAARRRRRDGVVPEALRAGEDEHPVGGARRRRRAGQPTRRRCSEQRGGAEHRPQGARLPTLAERWRSPARHSCRVARCPRPAAGDRRGVAPPPPCSAARPGYAAAPREAAVLDFYQITGSTSFAVRCALEEIGVEYHADRHRAVRALAARELRPGQPVAARAGDLRRRGRGLRDRRLPAVPGRAVPGGRARAAARRPVARRLPALAGRGSPTRSGRCGSGSWRRSSSPAMSDGRRPREGLRGARRIGAALEAELRGRTWCRRRRATPSRTSTSTCSSAGRPTGRPRDRRRRGAGALRAGRRAAAIARARDLDDLDERLCATTRAAWRRPMDAPVVDLS